MPCSPRTRSSRLVTRKLPELRYSIAPSDGRDRGKQTSRSPPAPSSTVRRSGRSITPISTTFPDCSFTACRDLHFQKTLQGAASRRQRPRDSRISEDCPIVKNYEHFYIDGAWCAPAGTGTIDVRSAATEEVIGRIPTATVEDVGRAVAAARRTFDAGWALTTAAERADWLKKLASALEARVEDVATTISQEVGMPITMSTIVQAQLPVNVTRSFADLIATLD